MKHHWAFGVIVIACVFFATGCDPVFHRTVYEINCDVTSPPEHVLSPHDNISEFTYQIYPSRQMVTEKVPYLGALTHRSCSIYDRNNWICFSKDRTTTFGMSDGEFFPNKEKLVDQFAIERVHKWKYWLIKTMSLFNKDYVNERCQDERDSGFKGYFEEKELQKKRSELFEKIYEAGN